MTSLRKYKIARVVVIVLLIYQSLTKGWYTLMLVPLLIIVIPLLIIFSRLYTKLKSWGKVTSFVAWSILLLPAVAYTTTVGFGDTDEVFLFGFLLASSESILTKISLGLSGLASFIYLPFHIYAYVHYRRLRRRYSND